MDYSGLNSRMAKFWRNNLSLEWEFGWAFSLYGTKQGTHTWYLKVVDTFTSLGYTVSMADKGVFYKIDNDGYIISAIATDDFTIIADSDKSVDLLKQQIPKHF